MNTLWAITILCVTGLTASAEDGLGLRDRQPILADLNSCVLCHGTPDFWKGDRKRLYVDQEQLTEDVHFRAGVQCYECHGGNRLSFEEAQAHSTELEEIGAGIGPFRSPLIEVQNSCARCHQKQAGELAGTRHGQAGEPDADGNPTPLACMTCHGAVKHDLRPVSDRESPVFLKRQIRLCGNCHAGEHDAYLQSVHGQGLMNSGLLVVAACADCHGAHAIYGADKERSTLHATNVASTCGECHRFVEERLKQSVHGKGNGPGGSTKTAAPGGDVMRKPSCTDCHLGHDMPDPQSSAFRLRLRDGCGSCHAELSRGYGMSLHGALDDLGYGPAAKCSDCHGGHDILPISDPNSRLAEGSNRLATCRTCHPYAVENFCDFQPHSDHTNAEDYPIAYWIYFSMEMLIYSVFAFFGLHTILWSVRLIIHIRRHGRPKRLVPGEPACVRFQPIHRLVHAVVIVSFLGLALTGLPLKYHDHAWAQMLARALGGFDSTSTWHRIGALLTIGYFVTHLIWISGQVFRCFAKRTPLLTIFFGPDSPVPRPRDALDMFRMFRWFLGLGPKPVFERFTYWEKFDYWAVFWGVGIIGTSGMVLWFPNFFSMFLPGVAINVAKVVHSEEALLATSFIFAVHFFGTHLRPDKFPIDMAILSGMVDLEELKEERPEYYERLCREGRLYELLDTVPPRSAMRLITVAGFAAVTVGIGLLIGIVLALFGGH